MVDLVKKREARPCRRGRRQPVVPRHPAEM
jgi:hypothetical protein